MSTSKLTVSLGLTKITLSCSTKMEKLLMLYISSRLRTRDPTKTRLLLLDFSMIEILGLPMLWQLIYEMEVLQSNTNLTKLLDFHMELTITLMISQESLFRTPQQEVVITLSNDFPMGWRSKSLKTGIFSMWLARILKLELFGQTHSKDCNTQRLIKMELLKWPKIWKNNNLGIKMEIASSHLIRIMWLSSLITKSTTTTKFETKWTLTSFEFSRITFLRPT